MLNKPNNLSNKKIIAFVFLLLAFISLSTGFYKSTDFNDYAGVAKFFAGSYSADIRSSHSLVYLLFHSLLFLFFVLWFSLFFFFFFFKLFLVFKAARLFLALSHGVKFLLKKKKKKKNAS